MEVELEYEFDVNPDQLLSILTSKEFYVQRYQLDKPHKNVTFERYEEVDGVQYIDIKRLLTLKKPKSLPSFILSRIPETTEVLISYAWHLTGDKKYTGTCAFDFDQLDGDVNGRLHISKLPNDRSLKKIHIDAAAKSRFLGGALTLALASQARKGFDKDYKGTLKYIKRHHL